jgi:hypothetical protein
MRTTLAIVGVVVAALTLTACGSDSASVSTATSPTPPASGMVIPGGGLSVAEAISTDAEPPLAVGGFVVGSGADARLCSGYEAGTSQPCTEPSLGLEGAGDVKNGTRVSLLGAVDGDTFVVSSTVQG